MRKFTCMLIVLSISVLSLTGIIAQEVQPDSKDQAKTETQAAPKTEAKAEAKTEAKTETKAEPKPQTKSDVKAETKTEQKSDAKTGQKPEAKPIENKAPVAEAKTDVKAEPKIAGKDQAKAQAKAARKSEVKTEVHIGAGGVKAEAGAQPAPPQAPPVQAQPVQAAPSTPPQAPPAQAVPNTPTQVQPVQAAPNTPPQAAPAQAQPPVQAAPNTPPRTENKADLKAGAKTPDSRSAKKAKEEAQESEKEDEAEAEAEAGTEEEAERDCDLLAREAELNQKIKEKGTLKAFEESLSVDSKIIASSIINGKNWLEGIENDTAPVLKPFRIMVASSCDLGFVVGTWEEKKGKNLIRTGQYIDVWKNIKAEWKIGVHAKNLILRKITAEDSQEIPLFQNDPDERKRTNKDITVIEKDFFRTMKEKGRAKAYDNYADDNIIRLHAKTPVQKGKKAVFLRSVAEKGYFEGKILKAETSKSRDISVVWGDLEAKGPQPYEKGSFLHIWVRNAEGEWKLIVDYAVLGRVESKRSIL